MSKNKQVAHPWVRGTKASSGESTSPISAFLASVGESADESASNIAVSDSNLDTSSQLFQQIKRKVESEALGKDSDFPAKGEPEREVIKEFTADELKAERDSGFLEGYTQAQAELKEELQVQQQVFKALISNASATVPDLASNVSEVLIGNGIEFLKTIAKQLLMNIDIKSYEHLIQTAIETHIELQTTAPSFVTIYVSKEDCEALTQADCFSSSDYTIKQRDSIENGQLLVEIGGDKGQLEEMEISLVQEFTKQLDML